MSKVNVFITIDTEHSIGGAFRDPSLKPVGNDKRIFGRIKGKEYGIPLIMDIADEYGIPLTFFVEIFNKYYFGEAETREVCEYILKRGHDVQLHLHPCWLNFKEPDPGKLRYKDNMSAYSLQQQIDMIAEGKELMEKYTGKSPVAFRAGNFGADSNTLFALAKKGFVMDSSYNRRYHKDERIKVEYDLNDVQKINGIHELPVTCFIQRHIFPGGRIRPLDINGTGFEEIRYVLNHAINSGMNAVTIVMHSFSFIKAHDSQYCKCSIRKNIIKRYANLCSFININKELLQTIKIEYSSKYYSDDNYSSSFNGFPIVPLKYSFLRVLEQLVN